MESNGILTAFETTYKGLATERQKLQAISENIANAKRAPDKHGRVYKRKVVMGTHGDEDMPKFQDEMNLQMRRQSNRHLFEEKNRGKGVKRLGNKENEKPYDVTKKQGSKMEYAPNHPRANKNGYVKRPDINVVEEMVDMMSASRAYEANVNTIDAAKKMANNALKI